MKVLIVDDEIPIREWISYSIKKQNIQCDIIGLAKNGAEAFELIKEKKPDLIFTDIKMPVMDGIELLNKIKEYGHICYTIILTSHSDFEYARQALQLNAHEYILKTEISDDIIKEIIERYQSKMTEEGHDSKRESLIEKNIYINKIIKEKITGLEEIANCLKKGNISLDDTYSMAVAVHIHDPNLSDHFTQLDQIDLTQWISKRSFIVLEDDCLLILANLVHIPSQLLQINAVHEVANRISNVFDEDIISVSSIGKGYGQLNKIICESKNGLAMAFYNETAHIIYNDSTTLPQKQKDKHMHAMEGLLSTIEKRNYEGSLRRFNGFVQGIKKDKIRDITFVKQLFLQIVNQYTWTYLSHKTMDIINRLQDIDKRIHGTGNIEELVFIVEEEIDKLIKNDVQDYSKYIKKAILYTSSHYASIENISEVAEHLNIHSDYFCRLFKREVGTTYIAYLTDMRMMKAMELLKNTDLKIYEVAEMVGYSNISYFSKSFKKKFNMTPYKIKKI